MSGEFKAIPFKYKISSAMLQKISVIIILMLNMGLLKADSMGYFKDPKQAVSLIKTMLVEENWEELSRYYDLSGADVDKGSLISGDFFIRKERPEVTHPAEFWRYKQPFSPEFKYQFHSTSTSGIVEVSLYIEIDQGEGMIQRGGDSFQLRKSTNGYQLIPKGLYSNVSEIPVSIPDIDK
jgi:hypothetical protein